MACLAATTTDADSARRARPAKPKVMGVAKPAKAAPAKSAKQIADEELARLADDPALGKADRVDGKGVTGLVAFTFDDGPNPDTTPAVIEALQKYDVPATFFVVSRRISGRLGEKNREVLAKEVAAGFTVGSHTVSHTNLMRVGTKTVKHEIDQSLRSLAKETGHAIGLFRPPYGALDGRGIAQLRKRGMTEVKWSIDPADWRAKDTDELRARTLAAILKQGGGVVLMHDVQEVTARSIALVLDDLEAANCQRLAAKQDPILPVSLHYFLRDRGRPRAIPEDVKQRTLAYKKALPGRCAARPKPAPPKDEPAVAQAAPAQVAVAPAAAPAPARQRRPAVKAHAKRARR